MKTKIIKFVKKETVLTVAFILAVISAFFVCPNKEYIYYVNWRVLGILLSLMLIMAGLQKIGVFKRIGINLLKKTKDTHQLSFVLVFLCFFSSMFITNDVALITFVPFSIFILELAEKENDIIYIVVLQTIAANLGSMLTPIGNPQNLYLYTLAKLDIGKFIGLMLPYTIASGIMLVLCILIRRKEVLTVDYNEVSSKGQHGEANHKQTLVYVILFILSILVVGRIIPYYIVLFIVIVAIVIMDAKVLLQVDYCLLFTFICFFVFIGNMGNIAAVKNMLTQIVSGREEFAGILSSQIISNVPAAILLSGFTKNYQGLIVGTNLGGLGTLIASMASLISYKLYAHKYNDRKAKYLGCFTLFNIAFLIILSIMAVML